jgi:hypothetical protein
MLAAVQRKAQWRVANGGMIEDASSKVAYKTADERVRLQGLRGKRVRMLVQDGEGRKGHFKLKRLVASIMFKRATRLWLP